MNKSKRFFLLTLFACSSLLMLLTSNARAWQASISDCQGCGSRAEAVVVDAAGDVIATGGFFYGSDVVKLSKADGRVIWRSEVMGHESRTYAQDIAIDSHGDVFVVFVWSRVVIKVSGTDGAEVWRKLIGGTLNALLPIINAVAVDADDNVIAAGTILSNCVAQLATGRLSALSPKRSLLCGVTCYIYRTLKMARSPFKGLKNRSLLATPK